jgi:tetratricopeptide (TPR) repeat protein
MCLPPFSDRALLRLILLGLALVVSACASNGPGTDDSGRGLAEQSAAGDPGTGEVPPEALTMYEQAVAVMASGELLDAELRFKEFLLQYPGYPGAYVNLAIIHVNTGNDEGARAAVDAALALDPDHAPALNQLGMLLRRNGEFLEAEAAYLKAVTASPDYALAHYNLGVLNELYLQRLDSALQHFERYQELAGEDERVEKWITDLQRRVPAVQPTANITE